MEYGSLMAAYPDFTASGANFFDCAPPALQIWVVNGIYSVDVHSECRINGHVCTQKLW